jgi:hypothetical protein
MSGDRELDVMAERPIDLPMDSEPDNSAIAWVPFSLGVCASEPGIERLDRLSPEIFPSARGSDGEGDLQLYRTVRDQVRAGSYESVVNLAPPRHHGDRGGCAHVVHRQFRV